MSYVEVSIRGTKVSSRIFEKQSVASPEVSDSFRNLFVSVTHDVDAPALRHLSSNWMFPV